MPPVTAEPLRDAVNAAVDYVRSFAAESTAAQKPIHVDAA